MRTQLCLHRVLTSTYKTTWAPTRNPSTTVQDHMLLVQTWRISKRCWFKLPQLTRMSKSGQYSREAQAPPTGSRAKRESTTWAKICSSSTMVVSLTLEETILWVHPRLESFLSCKPLRAREAMKTPKTLKRRAQDNLSKSSLMWTQIKVSIYKILRAKEATYMKPLGITVSVPFKTQEMGPRQRKDIMGPKRWERIPWRLAKVDQLFYQLTQLESLSSSHNYRTNKSQ